MFIVRCATDAILNKAKEEFDRYKTENQLSNSDLDQNPPHWFFRARGDHWQVEPANYNPVARDLLPDSLQPQ